MDARVALLFAVVATTTLNDASARAVNISNTWVLPEEGFPVFYRYFRDRISWYEADAVCQFHHANLVTVDSTSQQDAIRAYLKELDISSNVWIGLQKNPDKLTFSWTNFRTLTDDTRWQEAIPKGNEPLCVAVDPASDFRWHALPCGAPPIASFICELPVPSWATGSGGCLLTELPSLTVLYIPEQSAIQLTSDCGLDGTKRIACKGNADHDKMIKQLACTINNYDFEEKSTKLSTFASTTLETTSLSTNHADTTNIQTTKPWSWTSNTVDTGDYGLPTRHRRETEDTMSPTSTLSTANVASNKTGDQQNAQNETFTTLKRDLTYMIETVTTSAMGEVTEQHTINFTERPATRTNDPIAQETSNAPEIFVTTMTAETKAGETGSDEYPSAINQGQLFSIIENGTVFDIIELNENGTEQNRDDRETAKPHMKDEIQFTTQSPKAIAKSTEIPYTTVIYNKEPTQQVLPVTNEGLKKPEQTGKVLNEKDFHRRKNINDLPTKDDDKTLSKEVEMFPVVADPVLKLNRTNRKEVPMMEDFNNGNGDLELDVNNQLPDNSHHTVEIKLHDAKTNATSSALFVTTKKKYPQPKNSSVKKDIKLIEIAGIEAKNSTEVDNATDLNESAKEMDATVKSNASETPKSPQETQIMSSQRPYVEVSDFPAETETLEGTGEPLQSEPQAQPRPNRQRQLTRPQRKTFYPYFFSRMLG